MNPHSGLTVLAARSLALACLFAIFALPASAGWKEKVLYSFQGGSNDGQAPSSGVVFDRAGNLYGVTGYGGVVGCTGGTCGVVYQLRPPVQKGDAWTETVLYEFKGQSQGDGSTGWREPWGRSDFAWGQSYSTTLNGGTGNCRVGCGTVFELSP